jgi:hypothetical protein
MSTRNTNTLTAAGARRLAHKIEDYWQARGYAGVKTKIVDHIVDNALLEPGERRTIYFVRSNIGLLGFPPRKDGAGQADSAAAA